MSNAGDLVTRRSDLSPTKKALLERWKRGTITGRNTPGSIPQRQQHSPVIVSLEQQRLWFLDQFTSGNALYNMAMALYLSGSLDVKILEHSFFELLRRHEILRTCFVAEDGEPMQVILPLTTLPQPIIRVLDLQKIPEATREVKVRQIVAEEAKCPFDLSKELPIRVTLLMMATGEQVLMVTIHHIVSDGWSIGIFFRELATLYTAFTQGHEANLAPLPIQYGDYAFWQRVEMQTPAFADHLHYWREHLANAPTLLLPTDFLRPALLTSRGAHQSFTVSESLIKQLKELNQREGVTFFITLLTAFALMLRRYSGQDDLMIGTPATHRTHIELEALIGCFINTLALRIDLSGITDVHQLLQRVRTITLGAFANQDVPFEKLVEGLQPQRDMSRQPLCQVLFQFQNSPWETFQLPELTIRRLEALNDHARFDLELNLTETANSLVGHLVYNRDLFAPETIQRMVDHYLLQLETLITATDQHILTRPQLPSAEWQKLLVDWNATVVSYPEQVCIHELVAEQALLTPDAIAVQHDDHQISYRELVQRSTRLARYLQTQGVGSDQLIGFCVERSSLLIIGLLAILQTGAAYVPLDPSYPHERLAFILDDAQVSLVLTEQALLSYLPEIRVPHLCLDQPEPWTLPTSVVVETVSSQLAYVIYTSGSTGKPKGVQVPHRGVVNFLLHMQQMLAVQAYEHILGLTTLSFDIAVLELLLPLITGARLLLIERNVAQDGLQLAATIEQMAITLAQATPATWRLLLATGWRGYPTLRMLCGGEALSKDLAQALMVCGKDLWNLYGPTETTIWSTAIRVIDTTIDISIGRPIANTQIYLLDHNGSPVPQGAIGEISIGGAGVAQGYLRRPSLTAERFVPDSFSMISGARLYRTGDLARYRVDGTLEYLGRSDQQVKVRGHRIEPGEIENVLVCHPQIRQAVVVTHAFAADDLRLVAYLVPTATDLPTARALQAYLQTRLPSYMIPSAFQLVEAIPLTPNGKVDRQKLSSPDEAQHALTIEDSATSETPIEELLMTLWSQVLGRPIRGTQDNFFILGGHSLLAAQLISRLRDIFQINLPLRSLFENPTIIGLARTIEQNKLHLSDTVPPLLQPFAHGEREPQQLSFAQQRLWFLDRLQPGSTLYNIAGAFKLIGELDIAALEHSLWEIIQRHESLRTIFVEVQGEPVQICIPVTELSAQFLTVIDLRSLSSTESEIYAQQLAHAEALCPFQLTSHLLLRVTVLWLKDDTSVLLLTIHHIASDGWSIGVLLRELGILYTAYREQAPSPLTALPLQYADFAHWQRQWLTGTVLSTLVSYWQQHLRGYTPLQLPVDFARTNLETPRSALQTFVYPPEFLVKLNALSQQAGVTTFMILMAAFQVLLARISGQDDIIIGTDIAHRTHETAALIGLFVNQLALRIDLSGQPTFREVLKRVRDVVLDAYTHQDLPFEKVVEAVNPQRTLNQTPLFQVKLSFTNVEDQSLRLPGLTVQAFAFDAEGILTKVDLTLYLRESIRGLHGTLVYNSTLFQEASMLRLIAQFRSLLDDLLMYPEKRITELALQTEEANNNLIESFNDDLEMDD